MKIFLSLIALIITTDSCKSSKNALENNEMQQKSLYGSYTISQIGENKSVSEDLTITIDENSDKIIGFSGCNSFFGTYTLENNNIAFSNISSSKKFCGRTINLVENKLLQTLNKVNSFSIKENIVTFKENDTATLIAKKIINTDKVFSNDKSDVVGDHYNSTGITYQSLSRGSFVYIHITKTQLSYSTDSGLMKINHYNYDNQDWLALSKLIDEVDRENFQKLKAPTEKRLFDGAAHATLAITDGDAQFMTPSFDHGHPPKEIETLVNKVLSLKESVVKQ